MDHLAHLLFIATPGGGTNIIPMIHTQKPRLREGNLHSEEVVELEFRPKLLL